MDTKVSSLNMSDKVSATMLTVGGGLATLTPKLTETAVMTQEIILQYVGAVFTVAGLIVAIVRAILSNRSKKEMIQEKKRENDLTERSIKIDEERLQLERNKDAKSNNCHTKNPSAITSNDEKNEET